MKGEEELVYLWRIEGQGQGDTEFSLFKWKITKCDWGGKFGAKFFYLELAGRALYLIFLVCFLVGCCVVICVFKSKNDWLYLSFNLLLFHKQLHMVFGRSCLLSLPSFFGLVPGA